VNTFSPQSVVVTGGAGFIGARVVQQILAHEQDVHVVVVDALTYAGDLQRLASIADAHGDRGTNRFHFVHGDIRDAALMTSLLVGRERSASGRALPPPDAVIHLAAESHVDRSIASAAPFIDTNVVGTLNLLNCAIASRDARPRDFRFVNVSTDEVYGSLSADEPPFTEESVVRPNNPYAASKAGADALVRAYANTYGLPCITTRSSNNFGEAQLPEKLIPLCIMRALRNERVPVYGDGRHMRDWIHVDDNARALWMACTEGDPADGVYNIGADNAHENLGVVHAILDTLGKPRSLVDFVKDRPGHDRRYATDSSRFRAVTGWTPERAFDHALAETVHWYEHHREWCERMAARAGLRV
jgi:dTDP-glucose 4,6-dehydratase